MANFKIALSKTLKFEGGYVNDPVDKGQETFKGVSRKNWPKWPGWIYVDNKDFTNPVLQDLVETFYKDNFWSNLKLDNFGQEISNFVFDTAVNQGSKSAAILLQTAISEFNIPITVDGEIGLATIKAYKSVDSEVLLLYTLKSLRTKVYIKICENNINQKKYFFGWLKRVFS